MPQDLTQARFSLAGSSCPVSTTPALMLFSFPPRSLFRALSREGSSDDGGTTVFDRLQRSPSTSQYDIVYNVGLSFPLLL